MSPINGTKVKKGYRRAGHFAVANGPAANMLLRRICK